MERIFCTLLLVGLSALFLSQPAFPATIDEIERMSFDEAYREWLREQEALVQRIKQRTQQGVYAISWGSTDRNTGKFTPTIFYALTCRLGQDAHRHESFLVSALTTNEYVSMVLDASPRLCSRYGVESEAPVAFEPGRGYSIRMRDYSLGPDGRRRVWVEVMKKPIPQPDAAANGSQPVRSKTNSTSSTAGSRR